MTELQGWCITSKGSWVNHSATHRFTYYETLILRRPMYYCNCGKKISPEEYLEYSKYLIARNKVMKSYKEKLKNA